MKTNLYKSFAFSFLFVLVSTLVFGQGNLNGTEGNSGNAQNCVVSAIYGPDKVNLGQNVEFYVTSVGKHIWSFPAGVTVIGYEQGNGQSVTVSFDQRFTSGTISVRRNGPSCANVISSKLVVKNVCDISVDLGSDRRTFFGYSPKECALINPVISKGTAPFTYAWSDGSSNSALSACPSQTSDISLTVTDANGCKASDDLHICVTDVRCYAGNSGNLKVEVCHKNGKTLCVSKNAVATLLRIGGSLGDCSEKDNCNYVDGTARLSNESNISKDTDPFNNVVLDAYTINESHKLFVDLASEDIKVHYQIIDLTGKTIKHGVIHDGENRIDIHHLKSGVYFLKTEHGAEDFTQFVVK